MRRGPIRIGRALRIPREVVVARFGEAPISVHWSVLLAFPFAWAATGSFAKGLVALLACTCLFGVHELGHALVARRLGLDVISLRVFAFHGLCKCSSPQSRGAEIALAWGGVAAQFVLCVVANAFVVLPALVGLALPDLLEPAFFVWVPLNVLIAFFNLLPVAPLDGAVAWRFVPLAVRAAYTRLRRLSPPRLRRRRKVASQVVVVEFRRISRNEEPR